MSATNQRARLRAALRQRRSVANRLRRLRAVAAPLDLLETRSQARERLVERPVFLLSSIRSGSTLLRMLLDAHPEIRAPHELHLSAVNVTARGMAGRSMGELGLSDQRLQFLLWDRILSRELLDSGKRFIVEKTPSNSMIWRQLLLCWPDAQFIILRRDPAAMAASWRRVQPDWTPDEISAYLQRYITGLDAAYAEHSGLLTHYEELVRDPTRELTRICEFIGVRFEPGMLDYAAKAPVRARRGLGDWSTKIRSGRIQVAEAPVGPDDLPPGLEPVARAWGYR